MEARESGCPQADLRRAVSRWLTDGKAQGWSHRTLGDRRQMLERFCWWLENEEKVPVTLGSLSPPTIRSFLAYLRDDSPQGRWGSDHHAVKRETRPSTVATYHRHLRAFVNFCLAEGLLVESPLRNVKPPRIPSDQVQPLSMEQVQALVNAARGLRFLERNAAVVFLLVDTGLRVSEACSLKVGDVDREDGALVVMGKGNKRRRVYMTMCLHWIPAGRYRQM